MYIVVMIEKKTCQQQSNDADCEVYAVVNTFQVSLGHIFLRTIVACSVDLS